MASVQQAADGITLVERVRSARRLRIVARAAIVAWLGSAAFAIAASALLLLAPGRHLNVGVTAILVVAFAVVAEVNFEIGGGFAVASQLAFVPMALALPARVLPAAVAAGLVLAALPQV